MDEFPESEPIFFKKRMSAEKRHEQIIKIARRLFAERGFHGTTTRELAKAAGISEALLFRHFASKRVLYQAMLQDWLDPIPDDRFYEIMKMNPGAEQMIAGSYYLSVKIVGAYVREDFDELQQNKLIYQSLLSDGTLAMVFYELVPKDGFHIMRDCLEVMYKNGEADNLFYNMHVPIAAGLRLLTATQIAMGQMNIMTKLNLSITDVVRDLAVYNLLGMGIHHEVISKYLPKIEKKYGADLVAPKSSK